MITPKEFDLALLLFRNLDHRVPRHRILASVWGDEFSDGSRTLDAHIAQIRRRLGLRRENGLLLSAVYGYGYLLQRVSGGVPINGREAAESCQPMPEDPKSPAT